MSQNPMTPQQVKLTTRENPPPIPRPNQAGRYPLPVYPIGRGMTPRCLFPSDGMVQTTPTTPTRPILVTIPSAPKARRITRPTPVFPIGDGLIPEALFPSDGTEQPTPTTPDRLIQVTIPSAPARPVRPLRRVSFAPIHFYHVIDNRNDYDDDANDDDDDDDDDDDVDDDDDDDDGNEMECDASSRYRLQVSVGPGMETPISDFTVALMLQGLRLGDRIHRRTRNKIIRKPLSGRTIEPTKMFKSKKN